MEDIETNRVIDVEVQTHTHIIYLYIYNYTNTDNYFLFERERERCRYRCTALFVYTRIHICAYMHTAQRSFRNPCIPMVIHTVQTCPQLIPNLQPASSATAHEAAAGNA